MYKCPLIFYLRCIKKLGSPSRIINFSFQKYKNKTFLIQPDKNLTLTFGELSDRAGRLASFLKELGLEKGDCVAFTAQNCIEYFQLRSACHLAGIIFFGLPVYLTQEDIIYFLNKAKAKAVFYRQQANFDIDKITKATQVAYSAELDSPAYKEIFQKTAICHLPSAISHQPSDISTLNLSSATTQKTPKIIQLSNKNWTESVYNYIRNSGAHPNKKIVFLCSVSFLTAGSTTFLPSILAGATQIVINEDFSPDGLAGYIKKYQVNRLYITPSRLLELLEYAQGHNERLNTLENIITGTERIPAVKLKEAIDFFGSIITVGYGMVEALPPIAMLTPRDYHSLDSVGKVSKGVKIKILEDGRIAIKSNTVSPGYLDNLDENVKCFKNGRFYSSDYGSIDKEGFLSILGRKEEILSRTPRLIFAKEVEDKLYALPFIKRCLALAKDNRIFIFASLQEKIEEGQVKMRIYESLENSNLMELLSVNDIIIKEILPINPLGKLDRRRIEEEIRLAVNG